MTTDAIGAKDRTLLYALLISIIVHVIILLPIMKEILFKNVHFPEIKEAVVIPMEFELVSPPQNPTPSRNISKYLSTVSSRAGDVVKSEKQSELPHSEGNLPFVESPSLLEGSEGGGKSELPPLPDEQSDLGEAIRRSKFYEEISPSRKLSLPEKNVDFKNEGSTRASIGGISINTTAWDFAPYLLDLKHRIKQHWIPPLAFTALGAIHGFTILHFRIMPDGTMQDLSIEKAEGHESLARSSMGAVKGSAPFRPLPDDFPEDYLDVTFGFYYLLPGDEEKYFRKE